MLQKRKVSNRAGVTLIEIMVSIGIITVVVLGVGAYRYQSALNVRKADIQITSARLALFLLNNWKGQGGDSDYDPEVALGPGLTIYNDAPGPAVPSGFTALDPSSKPNYQITANRVSYYTTLSYKDEADDMRLLNVSVAWTNDHQTWSGAYQSANLTTYAE